MEKVSSLGRDYEQMKLPPGFRFHPTDEELITHYLSPKVLDSSFCARAIAEVDLNRVEPWDLPWKAKMGEREWYFFCIKDRKYPTGMRANRATAAGYWKATGKDKEIFKVKTLVGMKKTLVFYKGRAPKGEKTNWVMHEYRLEAKSSAHKTSKNEWVTCRVFRKSSAGKRTHISAMITPSDCGDELQSSTLPLLMDLSSYDGHKRETASQTSQVTCLSDPVEDQKRRKEVGDSFNYHLLASSSLSKPSHISNSSYFFPKVSPSNSQISTQLEPYIGNMHFIDPSFMRDQSILGLLLENDWPHMKDNSKAEPSQDTAISADISSVVSNHDTVKRSYQDQQYTITSSEHVNLDCLWNY